MEYGTSLQALLAIEDGLRLGVFLGMLGLMAIWELAAPQRRTDIPKVIRWSNNLALVVIDSMVLRLALPILAVGVAIWAQDGGVGLFNAIAVPPWLAIGLSVVLLDLAIYGQHIVFHKVPVLWRLHRMHHSDPHFDVTTGLRFHPIEIVLSMLIKMAVVLLIGAPPEAVLLFEVILNAASLFNHSNIHLPPAVDATVRVLLVTPDMHRVHHSEIRQETDSNYGFSVPWWDRLFGTYRQSPKAGQGGVVFGIGAFRARRELWLDRLLTQPFRRR